MEEAWCFTAGPDRCWLRLADSLPVLRLLLEPPAPADVVAESASGQLLVMAASLVSILR